MRTYLPYSDFAQCAECFTMKRLTKQRHDALEILYLLSGRNHPERGDRFMYNSPPKKVWQHCPLVLIQYGLALCAEYEKRTGKPDPVRSRFVARDEWFRRRGGITVRQETLPKYFESETMQRSHRAILARQDAAHYAKYGFERDPDDEKIFYWPVEEAVAEFETPTINDSWSDDDGCDCESCLAARNGDDF